MSIAHILNVWSAISMIRAVKIKIDPRMKSLTSYLVDVLKIDLIRLI